MDHKERLRKDGPSKNEIRSAKRGWALIAAIFASLFGTAYIMAEI